MLTNSESYLEPMLSSGKGDDIIEKAIKKIKFLKLQPTAIVGCGVSGLTFACFLAQKLKIGVVAVRKSGEKKHSSNKVEGLLLEEENNLLIVDDLIDTGATIKRIIKEIEKEAREQGAIVNFLDYGLLYHDYENKKINNIDFIDLTR